MSDVDRVQRWIAEGALSAPDRDEPTFVDLANALATLSGSKLAKETQHSAELARKIGPAEHIVFVLVDGMGEELLAGAPARGFLQAHEATVLRAVFPSTTAAALTSLATGEWPSEHASCGWWMYLAGQKLSVTTLKFVERFQEKPLESLGVGIEEVLPIPSMWRGLRRDSLALLMHGIQDEVFARYMGGEMRREGYGSFDDALERVVRHVEGAAGSTFTYVYLPHADSAAHEHGLATARAVLGQVDAWLSRLLDELGGRARVVVSADHGMVDLPADRTLSMDEGHELMRCLEVPPTGEPTTPIFHVSAGKELRFEQAFQEAAGHLFALLTPDDVERLRLLGPGPLCSLTRSRLGTFMGLAREPAALYVRVAGSEPFVHEAVHSGLTPSEMRIPLVIAGA